MVHLRLATFVVKPEAVADFSAASAQHVAATQREAGVLRFELLQSEESPQEFVILMEFQDDDARAQHFATTHFQAWRALIAPWLAAPIRSVKHRRLPATDQDE